jgi:hypothetical protein
MSSRRERKEQLRRERIAREHAAVRAASRRRKLRIGGLAVVAAAGIAVVVALSVAGGGKSSMIAARTPTGAGTQAGLRVGAAPWPPEYQQLSTRLNALNLPQTSDYPFHIHAMLRIYVDGRQVQIPAGIGIDPLGRFIAPLHTHDASGIVHMEAVHPFPATLGEFLDIWGVKFTPAQIGGYQAGAGNVLAVYVNGRRLADPANYVMKAHDAIVIGYGKPGSFPIRYRAVFPFGL